MRLIKKHSLIILAFVSVLSGALFVFIPRGEEVLAVRGGASCDVCMDIKEVTTTEAKTGFPLVWRSEISKDGSDFAEIPKVGAKINVPFALVDFITGFGIAAVSLSLFRRKIL